MTRAHVEGPYDVSLVEGSITTEDDVARIVEVRAQSRYLVTIGACAATGGIQALRNFVEPGVFPAMVYAHPEYLRSLDTSTPVSAHVAVDYELRGCPIDRFELLEVILALLAHRRPIVATHSVCQECKARGTVCLAVTGECACLGPVTRAGCHALCPSVGRGCFGCFGPSEGANVDALMEWLRSHGHDDRSPEPTPADLQRGGTGLSRRGGEGGDPEATVRRCSHDQGVDVTHGANRNRTVSAEGVARVEGEGSLRVVVHDGTVSDVSLDIFEPPRYFEAMLVGRHFSEAPDITARICGICPVAYQLTACAAMEDATGIVVSDRVQRLRRLLYCGEWIQSHALHVYLLHAPDFLGCQDAVELAEREPGVIERGLALKRTGNLIMETVGGRSIHPVNVRVGGFYSAPEPTAIAALKAPLERARDEALATVRWVAGFDFPDVNASYRFVALRQDGRYAIDGGRPISSDGLDVTPQHFGELSVEEHVARSTALHARLDGRSYLTGPLARYALNQHALARRRARGRARRRTRRDVRRIPFRASSFARVELVFACDEALRLVAEYEPPVPAAAERVARAGIGTGVTEAPRGLLLHQYEIDGDGNIVRARIMPPTSQNQLTIEEDLRRVVEGGLDLNDDDLQWRCEQAVRNHDPCISCAAHFLDLKVERS